MRLAKAVVRRELEDLSFVALILRPHDWDKSADVMYADDGNIERDVPYEEMLVGPCQSRPCMRLP